MLNLKNLTLAGLALTGLLIAGCQSTDSQTGRQDTSSPTAFKPFPAPAWESTDMDGKIIRSSDFAGKVVILDFWATWCSPCIKEIPGFIKLQEKYGQDGLVVIGADIGEDPEDVKEGMKELGINYQVIASTPKLEEDLGGVDAVPMTFIIDRKGQVVKKHVGFTSAIIFEVEIKPLLAQTP